MKMDCNKGGRTVRSRLEILRRTFAGLFLVGLGTIPGWAQVPTNSLTLWVDANSLSYLSDGSNVPVWTNQSTLVNLHLTQGTVAAQPTLRKNVVNGNPVVRFDGLADFLQSGLLSNFVSASQYTIFSVVNPVAISTTNTASPWVNDAIVEDSSGFVGQLLQGTNVIAYNWDGNADQVRVSISTGRWSLVESRHESGQLFIHNTLGADQSTASSNTTSLTPWTLRVGIGSGNHFLDGDIAEMLIYRTALSPSARNQVEEYLYLKYSIPEPSMVLLIALGLGLFLRPRARR